MNNTRDISNFDFDIIQDVVNNVSENETYFDLVPQIETIFGEDIRPIHYLVLGYLIGVNQATDFQVLDTNLIHNNLCQRQN